MFVFNNNIFGEVTKLFVLRLAAYNGGTQRPTPGYRLVKKLYSLKKVMLESMLESFCKCNGYTEVLFSF